MIDQLYDLLAKLGYIHPLHPPLTHGPIGGVIVAFLLGYAAYLWPRKNLLQSGNYAVIIAFILFFPTVAAGILDWQHYFSGAFIYPIKMKIALTTVLMILLAVTLLAGQTEKTPTWLMTSLFTLCLFDVLGLGYYGGQLVYEGRVPKAGESYTLGRRIFVNRCSGCHMNGGNIFYPNLPLRTAPQLENYDLFAEFVRNPKLPNGQVGPMPAFTSDRLSDSQIRELYEYLLHAFTHPTRYDHQ